jgi:hypothetical protein
MRALALVGMGLALAGVGCSPIEQQSSMAKPAVAGRAYVAGVGDVVMDLKRTESLPNIAGKADIFGRMRDTGRVLVQFVGLEGNQAVFVRQDVTIQTNETTMSRSPMVMPTYQNTTLSGNVGVVPVSGTATTTGLTYLPPQSSSSYPIQGSQIRVAAPIGGSVLVEGHRISVLRAVDGGIEYSVN